MISVDSSFELGGITKHLITGPAGNSDFVSPRRQCFPPLRFGLIHSLFHVVKFAGRVGGGGG